MPIEAESEYVPTCETCHKSLTAELGPEIKERCEHHLTCPFAQVDQVIEGSTEDELLLNRYFTKEGRRISFAVTQPLPLAADTDPGMLLASLDNLSDRAVE